MATNASLWSGPTSPQSLGLGHGPKLRQHTRRAAFVDLGSLIRGRRQSLAQSSALERSAVNGLGILQQAGFQLIVLSQEPGVAFGLSSEAELSDAVSHLRQAMRAAGLHLSGFYYCPHHPDGTIDSYRRSCRCRSDEPGLLLQAASELGLTLAESWRFSSDQSAVYAAAMVGCEALWLRPPQPLLSGTKATWALAADDLWQGALLALQLDPARPEPQAPKPAACRRALAS